MDKGIRGLFGRFSKINTRIIRSSHFDVPFFLSYLGEINFS